MRYLVLVVFWLLAASAGAEEASVHSYPLPKHGFLALKVPSPWQGSVRQPPDDLPPTVVFTPRSGAPFQVLVTPMWSLRPEVQMPNTEEIKMRVRQTADGAASQAVEKAIEVKELKGVSPGYYFSATDRAPKPGEYKLLTQGVVSVNDLVVTFTILTNDGQEAIVKEALSMLSMVEHRKP